MIGANGKILPDLPQPLNVEEQAFFSQRLGAELIAKTVLQSSFEGDISTYYNLEEAELLSSAYHDFLTWRAELYCPALQ